MSRYKIVSIEKTTPPAGSVVKRWYKFIIANDKNTMTNLRSGTEKEVRLFAGEVVKRLNQKYLTHIQFKHHKPANEMINYNYI